jgi:Flp pilus assembly protein TadG
MASRWARPFLKPTQGNLAIVVALTAALLVLLTGMGVDYTFAVDRRAQLDAAADAAALSGRTPAAVKQSDSAITAIVRATFNAQAAAVTGTTYDSTDANSPAVAISYSPNGASKLINVAYTTQSKNFFPNVLGRPTIAIGGRATAMTMVSPNIDFYLLLDTSPSMTIAATSAGMQTLKNLTLGQEPNGGGCAFGCHESTGTPGNPTDANGRIEDNYTLAHNNGVALRIDLLQEAVKSLLGTARTAEINCPNCYRFATYGFDLKLDPMGTLTSDLTQAIAAATGVKVLELHSDGYMSRDIFMDDAGTDYDAAMQAISAIMPNPGRGTNVGGDTPQEVLIFVTDGVEDEEYIPGVEDGAGTPLQSFNPRRNISLMDNGWCTAIKNRGIRIAVLYTTYLPIPNDAFYQEFVAPFQPQIAPQMQDCASAGLYAEVGVNGDISAGLAGLFEAATTSAYLSH